MLHLIMTLLVHGAYMESAKCPKACSCIETLISSSYKAASLRGFDETIISRVNPEQKEDMYNSNLFDTVYKLKVLSANNSNALSPTKTCGVKNKETAKEIIMRNFSIKSVKISEKNSRIKRTLNLNEKKSISEENKTATEAVNKLASTEIPVVESDRNKDVFTYQITCAGLRNLKSIWIRYLPGPATELNIQRTNFQSFEAFQQILKESSTELSQLTVLSVSDSVINQNRDKILSSIKEQKLKKGMTEEGRHLDFLPFASLQNPKLRSQSETGFYPTGKSKNLQVLNLTNSTIVYLPQDTFHPFINLQILNLSNNLIEFIDSETFSSLGNLIHLDIHNNRLRSLNEMMFKNLSKLLLLDVSQNLISSLEPSTFQNLVSLNVLILASNPLLEKPEAVVLLSAGKRLQIVDISKTGLKQIPGTLERSVRILKLMGNLLLSIRCGDLDSYSLLSYLNLRSNKISYVEDDALGRLEFLKNLQISENNLFQIPKILPNNLEILNLSYNNIQNITNSDFLNLSSLKDLSLSYNQVTNIEENAFDNLVSLKVLDLSRNPILVLPSIYGRIQLSVLNLSYFTNIPGSYSNKYKQFPLQSPQSVKFLNLESSPVLTKTFLQDTKTLSSFTELEELNLRFTNLTTIRKDIFNLLPNLKVLKVEGNPWHCGKEILTLSIWLRNHENSENTQDEDEINTAHCLTPLQLYKINLITLEEKDFQEHQRKIQNQFNTTKANDLPLNKSDNNSEIELFTGNNISVSMNNSENVTLRQSDNKTEILDRDKCCGDSQEKVEFLGKNSTSVLTKKSEPNQIESTSSHIKKDFVSWSNTSVDLKSKIKNSLELKAGQVSLLALKEAEAVTAKGTLSLEKEYNSHLSFLILSSIGLVVMATLIFTSLYFMRTRRDQSYQRQNHDIEVCSISSLGNELW